MKIEKVRHLFDHKAGHWLVAEIDGKEVRGPVASYESVAELATLRGMTEYWGNKARVYVETPVEATAACVVTPYEENKRDWNKLWREETEKALASAPLYEG